MKKTRILAPVAGVLLLLGALGAFAYPTQNVASTMASGRVVVVRSANLLSSVRLTSDGNSSTVWVGGQVVHVSADAAEVVGLRSVKLLPVCKKVEVIETRDGIRILLDGVVAE